MRWFFVEEGSCPDCPHSTQQQLTR
jgi:hypothetical protein